MSVFSLNLVANVMLHMLLLFIILSVLFVYYISGVIKSALDKELSHSIDGVFNSAPANYRAQFKSFSRNISFDKVDTVYGIPDPVVTINNSWLFTLMSVLTLLFCVIFLMFVVFLKIYAPEKIHLGSILKENIAIFTFIGFIEFWFFTNVATQYIPVMPSFIETQFVQDVANSL